MTEKNSNKLITCITNLFKVKSLISLGFVWCIIYCTVNQIDIPKEVLAIGSSVVTALVLREKTKNSN